MNDVHDCATDWLDDPKTDIATESGFEKGYFFSAKRYKRTSAAEADCFAYNLWTFRARPVMYEDGFYRLEIPAGSKPEVTNRYLRNNAPGFDLILVLNNPNDDGDL